MNFSFRNRANKILGLGTVLGVLAIATVAASTSGSHADKKDKPRAAEKTVDSGTFGVFIKGQRVVSEDFSVQQENGNSVIKAQLKETASPTQTEQKSDLEITPGGELLRYEWSNAAGSSLLVLPKDEFLVEDRGKPGVVSWGSSALPGRS